MQMSYGTPTIWCITNKNDGSESLLFFYATLNDQVKVGRRRLFTVRKSC